MCCSTPARRDSTHDDTLVRIQSASVRKNTRTLPLSPHRARFNRRHTTHVEKPPAVGTIPPDELDCDPVVFEVLALRPVSGFCAHVCTFIRDALEAPRLQKQTSLLRRQHLDFHFVRDLANLLHRQRHFDRVFARRELKALAKFNLPFV